MAGGPNHTTFLTPLPGNGADQAGLGTAIRDALEALPGPWKVGVAPGAQPGRAIVTAYRDDGFECTVFLDGALERTFLYIRDQVANALQMHVLGLPRSAAAGQRLKN